MIDNEELGERERVGVILGRWNVNISGVVGSGWSVVGSVRMESASSWSWRWSLRLDIMKDFAYQANYITKVSETSFHGNDERKGSHCGVNESKQVFAF